MTPIFGLNQVGMHMARNLVAELSPSHSPREYSVISQYHVVPEGFTDLQNVPVHIPTTQSKTVMSPPSIRDKRFHQTIYTSEIW